MTLSDIDRYTAAYAACIKKAETIRFPEIAAIWFTIADSYKFLLEREQRLSYNDSRAREIVSFVSS
jgi:hypothetical protein